MTGGGKYRKIKISIPSASITLVLFGVAAWANDVM